MSAIKSAIPLCYDCSSRENLRICSQYTCICQKCYNRQIEEIIYYKKYRQLDPEIDQITPEIYLGNEDAALSKNTLQQRDITAICAFGSHLETPFIEDHKYIFKRYEIDNASTQIIIHLFEDHYQWVQKMLNEGRKVLMYCSTGVSRSAAFTIAYIMREKELSYEESLQLIKTKRGYVCPNSGFVAQLKAYQRQLNETRNLQHD